MQTALSFNFILAYERAPGKEEHPIAVDWDELEIPRRRDQCRYIIAEMLSVIDRGQILKRGRFKWVSRDDSWLECGSATSDGIL